VVNDRSSAIRMGTLFIQLALIQHHFGTLCRFREG
jgi:hypothetical protein